MKRKLNKKGIAKRNFYGFMSGSAMVFNTFITATFGYAAFLAHKSGDKRTRNSLMWITAVSTFSTWLSIKNTVDYIKRDVANYDLFIYEPTEEEDKNIQEDTYTV